MRRSKDDKEALPRNARRDEARRQVVEETRRIVEEYAKALREIIESLRRRMN
jgi:hypothetical protein